MSAEDPPPRPFRVSLGIRRPLPALLVIVAMLGLTAFGLWTNANPQRAATPGPGDAVLYKTVIEDVGHGQPYYQAAAQEQRRQHYPLRPFVVVRPPLLAVAMAALPNELSRRLALAGLALVTFGVWGWRAVVAGLSKVELAATLVLLATGLSLAFASNAYAFHETWAGLLIALSLALRHPHRWGLSLLIGVLAAATRELAAAYLLAMAVLALRDGERREAVAWVLGLVAIAAALVAHATAVEAQLVPGDLPSQGWLEIGGWPFALAATHWNAFLIVIPRWAGAVALPLALLGLAAWRDPLGERVALTVFGYLAAFFFVGRPENSYWGLLIAPLWPLGLLAAPYAVAGLAKTLAGRGRRDAALTPP